MVYEAHVPMVANSLVSVDGPVQRQEFARAQDIAGGFMEWLTLSLNNTISLDIFRLARRISRSFSFDNAIALNKCCIPFSLPWLISLDSQISFDKA